MDININTKLRAEIKRLMSYFDGSFINRNFEVILNRQYNIYFRLEDVETVRDLKLKLLYWVSRSAHKGVSRYRQDKVRLGLCQFFKLDYMEYGNKEWGCIYCKLGNQVNTKLANDFIDSNYDMTLLTKDCDCVMLNK